MRTILLLLLFLSSLTPSAEAQKAESLTILDYYCILPLDYFTCNAVNFKDSKASRRQLLKVTDLKNNYIEASVASGVMYMTMYRNRASKQDILVIQTTGRNCNSCGTLDFLVYDAETGWETAQVTPWGEIAAYLKSVTAERGHTVEAEYIIPQGGDEVISAFLPGSTYKLFDLKWGKQKFDLILPESN